MVKCKICDDEFESEQSLHPHLRKHKIRIAEYYQKFFPRRDLFSGDLIKFKNKDYYFSTDFNSRPNMKRWLNDQSPKNAREYTKNLFQARVEKKKLKYSPTQVELRTVMFPPIQCLNLIHGNYYKFCSELNLENRFSDTLPLSKNCLSEKISKDHLISVDSREQRPLKLSHPIEVRTLKFGDYTLDNPEAASNCYIERKSLSDFIGTMSGGLDRFHKEIQKAEEAEAYVVVLVERNLNECSVFNRLPYVSKKIKATPEYIFRNMREIIQKYKSVQFLFVKGRKEASEITKKILFSKGKCRDIDLQLAYDLKLL